MRLAEPTLSGTTRARAAGTFVGGVLTLACSNTYGMMSSPLNVPGTEIGANCEAGQTMTVLCAITGPEGDYRCARPPNKGRDHRAQDEDKLPASSRDGGSPAIHIDRRELLRLPRRPPRPIGALCPGIHLRP